MFINFCYPVDRGSSLIGRTARREEESAHAAR
jgi:hypothetical protein